MVVTPDATAVDSEKFVVGDFRDLGAVIPSLLDDYGLDPYEFRVYARLARRAGNHGQCWESIPNIAKACKMSDRKAQYCLRLLEKARLITRHQRINDTTLYSLNHFAQWVGADKLDEIRGSKDSGAPDAPPKNSKKSKKEGCTTFTTPGAPDAPKGFPLEGFHIKQKQKYEHELFHRAHSSHGGDRALFFDQSGEDGHCHGEERNGSGDRDTEQTAVDNHPVGEAEVITLPPTPVPPPPSPAEKFSSVRVEKKARAAKIKFTVNHLGWLQLPKGDRYAFARWLAVRRMKYQLALSFGNVKIANDSSGKTKTKGNQLWFKWGKESWLENEMFEGEREDNPFDLTKLRDTLDDRCMVTQEEFNDFLEYAFMDTLKWLDENGVEGRRRFKYNSPAFTFLNSDNEVFAGIKDKYRTA